MKAAVLTAVSAPLVLQEVEKPSPSDGEALVALRYAALNHRDVWIQKGLYAGLKFPIILGSDGAGTVVECRHSAWLGKEVIINPSLDWGPNEKAQQKSFRILGLPDNGTFAEFLKIPIQNLCEKPAHLSWQEAAALPLAGLTAYRALFSRAALQPNEKVLITGIGGGVALFALQFALAIGAEVWVTSGSDRKLSRALAMGAKGGANYQTPDWDTPLKSVGFDVILDSAGGEGFSKLIDLAAPGARIVFVGATRGPVKELVLQKIFWKQLSLLGSTMGSPADFASMITFVTTHQIHPIVDCTFPLAEAETALRYLDSAKQFGKIALEIS
ncbi:MAG: zinc-binding dehydrogenase [Chloroherpetonaceae bacterium]|nr:zinc-binding dehydrogenase [Chloroherpetonaceae bacterium]MCS7210712.1 zinc-binding dehydrogenase [Chloroherpetonaceae bacterium]MDW8020106.1 zinc-binding dehydrogenase [Chloroherpetonaceae bacterium]MDW8466461.1 zinc-binding dehydrogenase [Chloroherpetonaceae bacterium]